MRVLLLAVFAAFLGFVASPTTAHKGSAPSIENEIVEHGGGCRKSSPPGQCCHMNHKTGIVHCH